MTRRLVALTGVLAMTMFGALVKAQAPADAPPLELFFVASPPDDRLARAALEKLAQQWRDSSVATGT